MTSAAACLYDGQLFVYSRRPSVAAFVAFAREMVEKAFAPLDPRTRSSTFPSREYVGDPGEAEARLHPPSGIEELHSRDPERLRMRPREDLFRRAAPAHGLLRQLPLGRAGLRIPPPPRHVVLGAALPAQLVAPGLRHRAGQLHGVPPALLGEPVANRLAQLQLLPSGTRPAARSPRGRSRPTRGSSRTRSRAIDPDPQIRLDLQAGRPDRRSPARRCTRRCRTRPGRTRFSIDFRTVHVDDVRESGAAPNARLGLHGHDDARLPPGDGPRANPGGSRRPLRRRPADFGRSRLSAAPTPRPAALTGEPRRPKVGLLLNHPFPFVGARRDNGIFLGGLGFPFLAAEWRVRFRRVVRQPASLRVNDARG